ncbi:hypothetical protein M8C21_031863 [Ambrosia artemisiifolia]|uniref:Uncharacterized protein n=1 Tax=Ambrosia artemisiifolia TaxID=4212 RepID=A0AAD5GYA0_AMBAR|nr:hypothetical protein M8C21_031863 [Ambrosia artemisiifolia]
MCSLTYQELKKELPSGRQQYKLRIRWFSNTVAIELHIRVCFGSNKGACSGLF